MNLDENAKEIELCKWRDNLIKTRDIKDDVWYVHPIHENYEANTKGEVRNKIRNSLIKGSSDKEGRTTISIYKKKKQKHRIVMECLFSTVIPNDYDIDHIDSNPANNLYTNLQILTKKEHCNKTAKTNPERGKKAGLKSSKKLKYIIYDKENNIIDVKTFNSVNEASRILKITRRPIWQSITNRKKDSKGNQWVEEIEEHNDIEGEEWREVPELPQLFVSNKGRVWFKYLAVQYKTHGSLLQDYYIIHYQNKSYKVHTLVCTLFIGPQPSEEHTVDHIDNNSKNNCVENLRWATKNEQAINRTIVKSIEVYDKFTHCVIKVFNSQKECCEEYNLIPSSISRSLKGWQLGSYKNLSVRFAGLSNSDKYNREINILNHEIQVLDIDKNKRKHRFQNLPIHITKQLNSNTHSLNIKFRGIKYTKHSRDINELIKLKEKWINEQKEYWTNIIKNAYKEVD